MSRQRTTRDEWTLRINYGQGWEDETTEDSYREIRARAKEYRENCPQYPTRIVCRRVKLAQ